jgi:hypothetical protein
MSGWEQYGARSGMLACPRCNGALPETFFNVSDLQPCPACHNPVRVEVFPALLAAPEVGLAGEALMVEGESSCFYHPAKRAAAACESCGRFLCALCDVDLNGQHLCPACLETGRRKGRLKQLENRRMLYDSMALTLALAPLLLFYFTIITAPATLYVVIRYWNAPPSIVGRGKWRMVVAFIVALVEIAGWILVVYFLNRASVNFFNGSRP